jgi:hypothetical protein
MNIAGAASLRSAKLKQAAMGGLESGLPLWLQAVVFLLVLIILASRQPDAIFHAQFVAEDGKVWYPDAYNLGWWHALFLPFSGIFQTVPRIGASFAQLVPLSVAPLVLTIFQFILLALPVNFLLSRRSSAWGSLGFRACLAAAYLALPDCTEIAYGSNCAQWPMALGAILLVVAAVPQGYVARTCEFIYLLLAGLTGPICIAILPVAATMAWKRREPWRWLQCAVLAACGIAHMCALFFLDPGGRPKFPLGASPMLLMRILSGDIFLGALVGRNGLGAMTSTGGIIFLFCIAFTCVALIVACAVKSEAPMKYFLLFTVLLLTISLTRPTVFPPRGMTVWQMMMEVSDIRYWVIPSLAFLWATIWTVRGGIPIAKAVSILFLCAASIGAAYTWVHPAMTDLHFADSVRSFEAAPPGTVVVIPINPEGWKMRLVKHDGH